MRRAEGDLAVQRTGSVDATRACESAGRCADRAVAPRCNSSRRRIE